MPTLFDQLGNALGGIDVSSAVGGQASSLLSVVSTVAGLIENPPQDFSGYVQGIGELKLPQFDIGTDFAANLGAIRDAIPTDLSSVTGDIFATLEKLQSGALGAITDTVAPMLQLLSALATLFSGDLSCGLVPGLNAPVIDQGTGGGGGGSSSGVQPTTTTAPAKPMVSAAQVASANAVINALPSPLNVQTLLQWLHERLGTSDLPYTVLRAVPILDDIRDPLATLIAWQGMDANAMLAQFAETLSTTASVIAGNTQGTVTQLAQSLATALSTLDLNALQANVEQISAALANVRVAVGNGDVSAINADIQTLTTALPILAAQQAAWQATAKPALNTLLPLLAQLPEMLEDQLVQLLSLLSPRGSFTRLFGDTPQTPPGDVSADTFEPIADLFDAIEQRLQTVLDAIDISAVLTPVVAPLSQASGVVAEIDQQLMMLTLDIKSRFASVEGLIDAIDVTAIMAKVQQAIDAFSGTVTNSLSSAFGPAKAALSAVIGNIDTALEQFDPAAITAAITQAIDAIKSVFEDPALQDAVKQIGKLKDIAAVLQKLSFKPATDTVIGDIDGIRTALEKIDAASLQDPMPEMLKTAMEVLPRDITVVTDPVIDGFGELIEKGPLPLLQQLKDIPAQVTERIRQYDPQHLLGDSLNAPYQQLLQQVQAFSPSDLLKPLTDEFDKLKKQLLQSANPGQLLQPLVEVHQQIANDIAKLKPGNLIEPLDQALHDATGDIANAIDLDALLKPLDDILEKIKSWVDLGKQSVSVLTTFAGKLNDLGDPAAQLDSWIGSVFAIIPDNVAVPLELTTALSGLSGAIDSSRSAALQTAIDGAFGTTTTALQTLNAQTALTQLVQRASTITPALLNALPDSANKTALLNLLGGIDATSDNFAGSLRQLAQLQTALTAMRADFAARLGGWDARYHTDGGVLAKLKVATISIADIKTLIRTAITDQFAAPVLGVLTKARAIQGMANAIVQSLTALTTALEAKITVLLAAPQALLDLKNSIKKLVDDIANINLDFIQQAVDAIYDSIREKFNALNPKSLQKSLDDAFKKMLDALSFDAIVPGNALDDLDADFDAVVDKLKALDPETLLVQPLQQIFDNDIKPIIDAFDLSPALNAIVDRLKPLEDELRSEMDRVNSAYQAMLNAAPQAA